MNNERETLLNAIARDVLDYSRNTLLVHLRFLDLALSQLELIPHDSITIMTDSLHIYYDPEYVLSTFKKEKEFSARSYLHMVLHCIYRHMFINPSVDSRMWDLACDIAVENIINELDIASCNLSHTARQTKHIDRLKLELKTLTAEKIYRYFSTNDDVFNAFLALGNIFCADDHEIWYMPPGDKAKKFNSDDSDSDSDDKENTDDENDSAKAPSHSNSNRQTSTTFADAQKKLWSEISERMQTDLETFSKKHGDNAGSLLVNLYEANRKKQNYSDFLRKFAVINEVMKINDDEFDYIFYTYGLQIYKNLPLIEPLEYKDEKQIKEFVIAIDTSGSTLMSELSKKFLQTTFDILKDEKSFAKKFNLRIIQCDEQIQEDVLITTQEEFDRYISTFHLKGLNGTDFRPVFEHVGHLLDTREIKNLKGLIYFTDGYGTFPRTKPPYTTAFVFVDEEMNNYNIPPWAIKLVLKNDEI